jgi:hypothetical protein
MRRIPKTGPPFGGKKLFVFGMGSAMPALIGQISSLV